MTTQFVTTPAGSRIPKLGTIAYHDTVGFGEVIGRSGGRLRIKIETARPGDCKTG